MIILGVDPGSRKAGYALVEANKRNVKYLTSGTLRYDSYYQLIDRLGVIYNSCEEITKEHCPDEIAIESLIYVKSIPALSKLAQARGAMIAAFMKTHQGRVFEYSPNLIKSSVTGFGHANKESIQKALSIFFGQISFKSYDESDALAIALCHVLNRGNEQRPVIVKKALGKKNSGGLIKGQNRISLKKSLAHKYE
jgi:crossover junction endodeoxyribonuclease RuvC